MHKLYAYPAQLFVCSNFFSFAHTFLKADPPPLQSPSSFSNHHTLPTTAKMKFIYFLLPLVSSALADSLITCPCDQQDCSIAADVSRMIPCSPRNYGDQQLICTFRNVPARTRTSSTNTSVATLTLQLPKTSVSKSVEALTASFPRTLH